MLSGCITLLSTARKINAGQIATPGQGSLTYTAIYDPVGNKIGALDTVSTGGSFATSFTHDNHNQLLSEIQHYGPNPYAHMTFGITPGYPGKEHPYGPLYIMKSLDSSLCPALGAELLNPLLNVLPL